MNITSSFFGALTIVIAGLLLSLTLFSFTKADRSGRQGNVRAMCTSEMFCQIPIYGESTSRRAVAVPCSAISGRPGFDTPDGFLHIGDYYFSPTSSTYVAFVGASIGATSTSENFVCNSPRFVESTTRPLGMREVHPTGDVYTANCRFDGKDIYVRILADEFPSPGTPRMIDPSQQLNCFYGARMINPSPRTR